MKPFTIISFVGVSLVLILVALSNSLDSDVSRNHIEALASQALQVETHIDGAIGISWSPGLHLTLDDVKIGAGAEQLAAVKQARIGVAVLPLLIGKVQLITVKLSEPHLAIIRDADNNFNFAAFQTSQDNRELLEIADFSFSGATISYVNTAAQVTLVARDCGLQMRQLRLSHIPDTTLLQNIAFNAELFCGEFQQNTYSGMDLSVTATAVDGVINLAPVSMQFLGGQGVGTLQADFTGTMPQYQAHYVLPQLNLDGLLNTLPPSMRAEGELDLTLNLAIQGSNPDELTRSANGTINLHGTNLTLAGVDLDEKFAQFESSQNFDLIDAGAFFFAGPLGLLATKGYDFTSLLAQTGGSTEIPSLISDWIITDGIAQAADVAMTTRQNRIALQGQLDLVNEQFLDVTLAMVDGEGCAVVQQEIGGSFAAPRAAPANIMTTLAGPIFKLLQQGVAFLTDNPCEVFYAGGVQAPQQ